MKLAVALASVLCGVSGQGFNDFLRSEGKHSKGDVVAVLANSLTSTDGIIPFAHYHVKYCQPPGGVSEVEPDLWMTLRGDHINNSPYAFRVLENVTCNELCKQTLSYGDALKFESLILKRYRGNLILDNLPVVRAGDVVEDDKACKLDSLRTSDIRGFAMGGCTRQEDKVTAFLYNHLSFTVQYNTHVARDAKGEERTTYFIVGFLVTPRSLADGNCKAGGAKVVVSGRDKNMPGLEVPFTYSVKWEKKDYDWGMRWDYYINNSYSADNDVKQHWRKILVSVLIILFMAGVVAIIIMRTLHLDFNRYNNPDNEDEMQEEVGWKLVHTDVFRPPAFPNVFAAVIGVGVQLLGMATLVLLLAALGFLSPSKRGTMITSSVLLFVLMAFVNGYVTARLQTMCGTKAWKTIFFSATTFPGFLFFLWCITEIALNVRNAANAADLRHVLAVIALWFGVCVPQAFLGASIGYEQKPLTNPLRYQGQPRHIPPQHWLFSLPATLLIPGLIPYAAAHWELELLMKSVWQGQVLHLYIFAAVVFLIVLTTIVETVIVFIYYQLVYEDYRWWWKSWLIPSGIGFYYLLMSLWYYNETLRVKTWLATWIYGSFCVSMGAGIVLSAGAVGFLTAWLFLRTIYTAIKIE